MKKMLLILIWPILLSACGAQPTPVDMAAVQTSIAATIVAGHTATYTPAPTHTPSPTWTPTATSTETPSPTTTDTPTLTFTPTPDVRVIDADPHDFMLMDTDLPSEAGYTDLFYREYVSPWGWKHIFSYRTVWQMNAESLGLDTSALMNDFVDAWDASYRPTTDRLLTPQTISNTVILFRNAAAAQQMVNEFSSCTKTGTEYTLVETDLRIGDLTLFCTNLENFYSGYKGDYTLVFSYRNYYHILSGFGRDVEVPLDFLADVARALLAKLEAAPLSSIVTYQPVSSP